MANRESYIRDYERMLGAATAWREANPNAELVFHPLGCPEDTEVLAGLSATLIRRVGGNHKTRELLRTMDNASGNQGTVIQADSCLEQVFGLSRAISGESRAKNAAVTAIPCPQCGADLNSRGTLTGPKPRAWVFCICGRCAAILRLDNTLTPRPATPDERSGLPTEILGMAQSIAAKADKFS